MYLGRLNLSEFHVIVVIISTGIDVFPPVLVGVAGEGELDVVPREDGVEEGGGGRPAGDEEEEERVEGPDDDEGVRGPPPRGQRGRVVVPSCSGERGCAGGGRASGTRTREQRERVPDERQKGASVLRFSPARG